jgi:hypothetical protein
VQAMKELSSNDPRSWLFQASIHQTGCQHGNIFFLPWHRMYLYWFERIVRQMSGFLNFALPYWNYSRSTNRRYLPPVFRDKNSPLYSSRNFGISEGTQALPESAVAFRTSLGCAGRFSTGGPTTLGFGGNGTQQMMGYGSVETVPHNEVHGYVGGLMGNINTAAQDPIFWLHHANIDRLWVQWLELGEGRADPGTTAWLDNPLFSFYDENGNQVMMTSREVLDTTDLQYVYDDFPEYETCINGVGVEAALPPDLASPQ